MSAFEARHCRCPSTEAEVRPGVLRIRYFVKQRLRRLPNLGLRNELVEDILQTESLQNRLVGDEEQRARIDGDGGLAGVFPEC